MQSSFIGSALALFIFVSNACWLVTCALAVLDALVARRTERVSMHYPVTEDHVEKLIDVFRPLRHLNVIAEANACRSARFSAIGSIFGAINGHHSPSPSL
ncbi:hypothetical protein CEXT_333901 [Caerostris extrusa]|uniref:Secreted protein n=1 Tax=Caerostris extrusa TaxID=172846 RepID=A0AAV4MNL4_CAEEX|nr:hypothetical protein CEXT_333901 [Caerostris extrusa]